MTRIFAPVLAVLTAPAWGGAVQLNRTAEPEPAAVVSPEGLPRPPFTFSEADAELLDEVQHASFRFLWSAVDPITGMVFDRDSVEVISVAGVGFQLSAIPVGVERGWITRDQGKQRTARILRALLGNEHNRKGGLFFHFLEPATAGPRAGGYEMVVSTIDSALLFAGVMTASSYFGGEIGELGGRIVRGADWRFFQAPGDAPPQFEGFISLGWRPDDESDPTGDGRLLPFYWADAGDEQRLVSFLAVGSIEPEDAVDPRVYYRLRRRLGAYKDAGEMVWFPWSGALFTSFFAHCWIDYAHMGEDDPRRAGVERRVRVDWWENARRTALMHRLKAIENPESLPTLGREAWGLSACDAQGGYLVPGLFPDPVETPGARAEFDFAPQTYPDRWGDGTVPPYAAGSAIMFTPEASMAALRHYRGLRDAETGELIAWRPVGEGGFGFVDAFNQGTGWVAPDSVAIDHGPLILAIENARTGFVWRLFHSHPVARSAMTRLGLQRGPKSP